MEININDEDKIVEIWLTNEDKSNTSLRTSLQPIYKAYKSQKYTVAVFESGSGDLYDSTLGLLLNNRTNKIGTETQKKKTRGAR